MLVRFSFSANWIAAGILFLFHTGQKLQAQDSLVLLDPAVVTATFSEVSASNTGRNIIVVKGEQVANLPVNSIDELLRYLPGVEMQARGPMGSQSDISIRGSTFQQVLVILDGIRLNDPLTGHFNAYIPIPPGEIDHIEILKGASSAIYGSEAVGGVVHIITKTFARTSTTTGAELQFTYGDYDLRNGLASGRWVKKNAILSAGIISNHSSGQQQRGATGFFDITSASVAFSQILSKNWTLGLRSAYDYRSFSSQNFYTTFVSDTSKEVVESWWQHGMLGYEKGPWKWQTDIGYKWLDDEYAFNSATAANKNKTSLIQALSKATYTFNEKATLTGGIQYFNRQINSNDRGNHTEWQAAFFAVLHYELVKNLFVDPAVRLDQNERSGFNALPQLNISYRGNKYQLRGSAGSSLRDADFTERFNNYNRSMVRSGRIGNPNLEAEKGLNYEVGVDYWLGKGLKISSSVFARNQQNLIDWVITPFADMPRQENLWDSGTFALSKNIWEVNTIGWELDLQYSLRINDDLAINAQGGALWVENNSKDATPGIYLSSQARWLLNFNALIHYKNMVISSTGLFKTRMPQQSAGINAKLSAEYFVANLKFQYNLPGDLSLFIQADNIGNVAYSDVLGAQMPGRWLMGGISWKVEKKKLKLNNF